MPRRRSIACDNCGFLVLKRDEFCERCGTTTPQAKRRTQAGLIYAVFVAITCLAGYAYVRHAIAGLGAG